MKFRQIGSTGFKCSVIGLERLRQAGRIRFLGISSNSVPVLETASRLPGISCIETAINPMCTEVRSSVLPKIAAAQVGVIGNQVFSSGQLLTQNRRTEFLQIRQQLAALSELSWLSAQHLLIQFALAHPGVTCVLTGTTQVAHLGRNSADALAGPLAAETRNSPLWVAT